VSEGHGLDSEPRLTGLQMYVKGFDFDERLMGLAFLDVNLYVTSIRVFKNFMLISDHVKSIWFVALQVSER
jgi:cleavage and polyadenylation specificity factor subunit 1